MRGFPKFLKKYVWCEFFLNFMHKTAVLKMFSLYTFKILLDVNNSLVCSNIVLLKMMQRTGIPDFLDSGRKSWMLDSGCWTLDAGL